MGTSSLEKRVATLEAKVAALTARKPQARWWENIAGSFANDPVFADAMRLGREWRESQRPKARRARKGKRQHGDT